MYRVAIFNWNGCNVKGHSFPTLDEAVEFAKLEMAFAGIKGEEDKQRPAYMPSHATCKIEWGTEYLMSVRLIGVDEVDLTLSYESESRRRDAAIVYLRDGYQISFSER